ncbi:MAG: hypothetical protein DRI69_09600 [Bacteroidetes bacterium]|nr:MAG: hypothetical protein DRI69_09600 [Bacteroidota bacterium]
MKLTVNQQRKFKQALTILLVGAILGPFYVMFADGFDHWYPYGNGIIVGLILASIVAIFELWVFAGSLRRVRFYILFAFRVFGYLLVIIAVSFNVFLMSRMNRFDMSYQEVWHSDEFQDYIFNGNYYLVLIFALVLIAGVNFTRQMSRKLGQGMLLAYISGRYRTPQREERIFMLFDLESSDLIADRLGAINFHNFLNDLFYDVTEAIVGRSGIIAQYVEDEVMVTWSMQKGVKNANCIRAFFQMTGELDALAEKYYENYGFVPKIRAALHCGPIIRAEIGEVKTEVSFFGDTINTTSRILDECHEAEKEIVVSKQLIEQIQLPELYSLEKMGDVSLRGKMEKMSLYSVNEIYHG